MEVEVFACPDDQQEITDEYHPARRDAEDVISEDSDPGDSQVREVVVKCEVVDREGLKSAGEDYDSDSLPFCGDESEGEREESADTVHHESVRVLLAGKVWG